MYTIAIEKPFLIPTVMPVLGRIAGGAGNLLGRAVRGAVGAARRAAAAVGIGRSGGT